MNKKIGYSVVSITPLMRHYRHLLAAPTTENKKKMSKEFGFGFASWDSFLNGKIAHSLEWGNTLIGGENVYGFPISFTN